MTTRATPSKSRSASQPRALPGLRRVLLPSLIAALGWLAIAAASGSAAADEYSPSESPAAADAPPAAPASTLSEQERNREAEAISRSVMSPFCPGRTVSSCPNAQPWRDDIRKWVGEGVPAAEIRARLAARVPEHNLLGVPPNRLGWVLPVGSALLAIAVLVFALRYLLRPVKPVATTHSASAKADPPPAASDVDYDARLDDELETLER